MAKSVCFFARVPDPVMLERVEFYAQDLRILRELGFKVQICTSIKKLQDADLFFIWWWTWAFAPIFYSQLKGKPAIITGVLSHLEENGEWDVLKRPIWERWLMQYSLKNANANIFISQLEYHQMPNFFSVNHPSYSPCTVETDIYTNGIDKKDNTILTVAWMKEQNAVRKCIPEIITAASIVHQSHPNVKFIIAGDTSTFHPIAMEMVERLGASTYIKFPGIITKEEKIKLMQRCRIFLQPTRTEGFGLAILEAMSCGAAVVTSRVGTVPEVASDTVAYVRNNEPTSIAEKIKHLLSNDQERQNLSFTARQRAELFSPERRRNDLKAIIETVLPQ